MTADRRKQELRILPDGTVWDDAAIRDWLASMNPAPRVQVVRLSIPPVSRPALNPVATSTDRSGRTGEPDPLRVFRGQREEAARRGAPGTLPTDLSAPPSAHTSPSVGRASRRRDYPPVPAPRAQLSAGRSTTAGEKAG